MPSHGGAHQTVLQLFDPPYLRELVAFAREQLLAQRRHRKHVEQRPVRVEGQRLDPLELAGHRRLGGDWSGSQCGARHCRRGTGNLHELPAIVRHFSPPSALSSNRDFRYGPLFASVTASTEPPVPSVSSSTLPNTSTAVTPVNPVASVGA